MTTYVLVPGAGGQAWYWHLGLETDEIEGGHLVALSHPRELVERLESYRLDLGYSA